MERMTDICGTCGCSFTYENPREVYVNEVFVLGNGYVAACSHCSTVSRHIRFCVRFGFPVDLSVPGSDRQILERRDTK